MKLNTKTRFASAILAACITTTSFAEATRAEEVQFTYRQQELATPDGQAKLAERIRATARSVCRQSGPGMFGLVERKCRRDIETKLSAKIWRNQPRIAAK